LLRDEELGSLISQSGAKWIFIGLESIDTENLKSVSKGFNKPDEYQAVLERLARHNLYAITSFIFGMDGDRQGVATRTLEAIRSWPPGLPVFGLLTPYPATPLYDRLSAAGRLTRPKHWLEFKPFTMAFKPLGITVQEAESEVRQAWSSAYSPQTIAASMDWLESKSFPDRLIHLLSRLAFRGIYFPQMKRRDWMHVLYENRGPILRLLGQALMLKLKPQRREAIVLEPQEQVEPAPLAPEQAAG
jgi:radical SAM superfamily enzyme YgiQ (UPF0313 family)